MLEQAKIFLKVFKQFVWYTITGNIPAEPEQQLFSLPHGEFRRGLWRTTVTQGLEFTQRRANISSGQGGHNHTAGVQTLMMEHNCDWEDLYSFFQFFN